MLLPMYALNQKISIRKRFVNLALAGFLLLSFSTNVLDFMWHGMNYPDSLPARQSFIYIFLILVMCFEAYRNVDEIDKKQILYGYLAAAAFLFWCEKFVESEDFQIGIEILTLLFVTIYAVILYLYRTREGAGYRNVLGMVTLAAVVAECTINTVNTSVGTTNRSAYLDSLSDYQALYEWTGEREEAFYRVEKFTRKTKNDAALAGYPSASLFSSTLNSRVMDLYTRLGMRHSKVYYSFDGATAFTSALLNVSYMFGDSDKYETELYELLQKSGEVYLYESRAKLPFGYVAPTGYDLPEGYADNGLRLQNAMIEELGIAGELFSAVSSENKGDDVVFTAKESGIYYALLTSSGTKKVEATGGSLETHEFPDLKKGSVLYLGYVNAGNSITLQNGDEEDETPDISAGIYRMDTEVLAAALKKLSGNHLENVVYDNTHVSGQITMEEAGRLILSIPYEDGWHITINGEDAGCRSFGEALMAFDLDPGVYTISLEYIPEGKYAGVVVSIVSVGVFALLMGLRRRNSAHA